MGLSAPRRLLRGVFLWIISGKVDDFIRIQYIENIKNLQRVKGDNWNRCGKTIGQGRNVINTHSF